MPDFKPYGATEVRRAAQAFITMRERIERHVAQRTEMLAGVSHDLKTPLTRLKLTLEMMPEDEGRDAPNDIKSMHDDIAEMNLRTLGDVHCRQKAAPAADVIVERDRVGQTCDRHARLEIDRLRPTAEETIGR